MQPMQPGDMYTSYADVDDLMSNTGLCADHGSESGYPEIR